MTSLSNVMKTMLMIVLTAVITVLIMISGYEIYKRFFWYEKWKSNYSVNGDWYGMMTIPSKDEVLMWEYRPYGSYENSKLGFKIETNRFGFRDEDYETVVKPEDVYRVAFIGDSTTLGFKVNKDDVFVKQFQNLANNAMPDGKVQALNFGIDGYNTIQIHELLKTRVLAYSPDKVVYMLNLNDFDLWNASGNKILYFKKPKLFFLRELYRVVTEWNLGNKYDYYHLYFNRNKDTVYSHILKMRDLLEEKKVKFLVVILPSYEYDFKKYESADLNEMIRSYLTSNKIEVFDLLPEFIKQDKLPSFYMVEPDDHWHPNKEGHRVIAQGLFRPILSDRLSRD
ncbi:MAG: hypothetical protein IT392_07235 [Nitrospirae bacterium]|nr:hypothetical protein [Nitrospirota bacterium]